MRTLSAGLFLASALLLAGCGDSGPKRYAVSGTISIKGKPIPLGNITFVPQEPGGMGGGSAVTDGKYAIAQEVGLTAGKYKVRLSAPDRVIQGGPPGAPGDDGPAAQAPKERFPQDYTDESRTPLTFEVKADGPNVFDHDAK